MDAFQEGFVRHFKDGHQRRGQAYYNAARDIDPDWARHITENVSHIDPFNSDGPLQKFIERWYEDHDGTNPDDFEVGPADDRTLRNTKSAVKDLDYLKTFYTMEDAQRCMLSLLATIDVLSEKLAAMDPVVNEAIIYRRYLGGAVKTPSKIRLRDAVDAYQEWAAKQ